MVHPVAIVLLALTRALSLPDAFDGVFGSSAGSLVGAYFVGAQVRLQQTTPDTLRAARSAEFCSSRQEGMPQYGCSLYYDLLTDGLVRPACHTRRESPPLPAAAGADGGIANGAGQGQLHRPLAVSAAAWAAYAALVYPAPPQGGARASRETPSPQPRVSSQGARLPSFARLLPFAPHSCSAPKASAAVLTRKRTRRTAWRKCGRWTGSASGSATKGCRFTSWRPTSPRSAQSSSMHRADTFRACGR